MSIRGSAHEQDARGSAAQLKTRLEELPARSATGPDHRGDRPRSSPWPSCGRSRAAKSCVLAPSWIGSLPSSASHAHRRLRSRPFDRTGEEGSDSPTPSSRIGRIASDPVRRRECPGDTLRLRGRRCQCSRAPREPSCGDVPAIRGRGRIRAGPAGAEKVPEPRDLDWALAVLRADIGSIALRRALRRGHPGRPRAPHAPSRLRTGDSVQLASCLPSDTSSSDRREAPRIRRPAERRRARRGGHAHGRELATPRPAASPGARRSAFETSGAGTRAATQRRRSVLSAARSCSRIGCSSSRTSRPGRRSGNRRLDSVDAGP